MAFDLGAALLTATISAVVKIAADLGLADPASELREQLAENGETQGQAAFEKAYQAALRSLGDLTEEQKSLLEHRPFLDAVLAGLLSPQGELDLQAVAKEWAGELPVQGEALRRFFRALNNALIRDAYWGEMFLRYQTLRAWAKLAEWVDERKILRQVKVDTQGGVYIEGDVNITGGNFVATPVENGETELKAYFRALAKGCEGLPLGIIDESFASHKTIPLKDVYIDLDVLGVQLDRSKNLHALRRALEQPEEESNGRVALIEVIAAEGRRMVLLGMAGSGKTTFVDYLTYRLARAYADGQGAEDLPVGLQGLLPVRLVLRDAAGHIPIEAKCGQGAMLWNALQEDVKKKLGEGAEAAWKLLKEKMYRGECLVLLDGLDEVAEAGRRRACLLEALGGKEGFLNGLKETQRVLLTARPYAYAKPEWQLQGCEVFNLAPLSSEQVKHFVKRWYASVRESIRLKPEDAQKRAAELAAAIEKESYLGDLASRPLLLTQMAMVHSTHKQLPEDRADLYEKTVELLLARWQRSGVEEQTVSVDAKAIRGALAELAYQTHRRQRATEEKEGPGDIPFGEMLSCFVKQMPKVLPGDLTAYLQNRTGVVVEREPGLYCFAHRSFQEYLAACHLLDTSVELSADLRKLVDADAAWWREVILLAIGKVRQGSLVSALDLLRNALLADELATCTNPSTGDWRAAVLGGLGLAELRVQERQAELAELPRNLPRARKWLVAALASDLPARERVEAGDVLARLGDERFDAECYYLPKDEMLGFVRVPGGAFWMGSDPKRNQQAYGNEQPQHSVEVSEFYIQRYPVTVAQFGAFVGQSGYRPRYPDCLKGIANHPVVNVTWDDAVAYCKWLEGWLREKGPEGWRRRMATGGQIRLPTEAEWEKAARGKHGRIYPWGERFDPDRANTRESGILRTSPVGSFPGGVSPYGVMDMAGNVREWCWDWYWGDYYRMAPVRNPIGPDTGRQHSLRGGSWGLVGRDARCANRDRYAPGNFLGGIGFRLVLSLAFSGS